MILNRKWPFYSLDYEASLDLRQEAFQKTPLDRYKTLSWMKNILEKRLSAHEDDVLLYSEDSVVLETSRANV